jgi:hypothetical protein
MVKRALILLAALTVAGAGIAYAATLTVGSTHLWGGTQTLTKSSCTLAPSLDTFVNESSTAQTNGGSATLDVIPDSGSRKYSYVQFDLSGCGVPTTGGADSATLSVFLSNAPKGSLTVAASRVTSAWSNSTTWATQPTTAGATDSKSTGTANGVWISFTVTADVDGFIKGSSSNYGWRLTESGALQNAVKDLAQFSSGDAAANKPQLVINYEK